VGRKDLRCLALRGGGLLLDRPVPLELSLLTSTTLCVLALTLLGGTPDRVLQALRVDHADRRGVALRVDAEVCETPNHIAVLQTHLFGELVHADGVAAHRFSLLTTLTRRPMPSWC
jgi:hypothetical protein